MIYLIPGIAEGFPMASKSICRAKNCLELATARGLCKRHYAQERYRSSLSKYKVQPKKLSEMTTRERRLRVEAFRGHDKYAETRELASWTKGGNNPKKPAAELAAAMRSKGQEILADYYDLLSKPHLTASDNIRMRGFENWLDRAYGRAPLSMSAAVYAPQLSAPADGTVIDIETESAVSPLLAAAYRGVMAERTKGAAPRPEVQPSSPIPVEPEAPAAAAAPEPEPEPEPAPASKTYPAPEPTPKPEPVAAAASTPTPEPPKAKPPYPGIPADYAKTLQFREKQAQEEADNLKRWKELSPNYPGNQVPASAWFQPDKASQGELEIVRFTLAPGGRIKRC